jgi:acyl-ACP thioesterase
MKYYYEYEMKYQESDAHKKVRLYHLEEYLLEVAGKAADDLGYGIAAMHPRGFGWILTRLSLEMYELPKHNDVVRFETWIEGNAHMLSTRDFRIYLGDRLIGQAKSIWAVLDLQKREIVNVFDEPIFEGCVDGEVIDMPRVRMTTIPEPTGCAPHKIVYSDIDYNSHCNSCRYLQAMLNAYLPDYYGKHLRLDINYSKEAMLGETLMTYYLVTDDGVQYQQKNEAGDTSCSAKISIIG